MLEEPEAPGQRQRRSALSTHPSVHLLRNRCPGLASAPQNVTRGWKFSSSYIKNYVNFINIFYLTQYVNPLSFQHESHLKIINELSYTHLGYQA